MGTSSKILVGGLIVVNLALVGLLLFRDHSVARVRAQADAAQAAPAVASAPALAERQGGTSFAEETAPAPAPRREPVTTEPASVVSRDAGDRDAGEVDPDATRDEPAPRKAPARTPATRPARKTATVPHRQPAYEPPPAADSAPTEVASNRMPEDGDDGWQRAESRPVEAVPAEPEPEPEPQPLRPETITVPAGTHVSVRLDVALNSRQVRSGDQFEASIGQDLLVNGRRVARAGDAVTGKVLEVIEAGKVKGREAMTLTLSSLTLAGKTYRADASRATFTAEEDHSRDAAVIGGSSVVGAVIGAIAHGGKGAAVGAAAGAAAGSGVVLSTKGKPVVLASGTRLDFTLEDSLRVTLPPGRHEREREERDPARPDRDDAGIAQR